MSKRKRFKHQRSRGEADDRRRAESGPGRHEASARDQAVGLDGERPARRQLQYAGKSGSAVWIYGFHSVSAALRNKHRVIRRLIAISDEQKQLASEFASLISMHEQPLVLEQLDRSAFERLLPAGAVHQGIAALVEPLTPPDLFEICDAAASSGSSLLLILDQVTDPHNVGAILRSAAAFGAQAVIVTERNAAAESGVLAKSASGALEHVPLVPVTNLARAMTQLKGAGFWCIGLEAEGGETLAEIDLSGRVALALGAEGSGLRRLTRDNCDKLARLPTQGPIGQLNVSNAAAIALYEVARRRPRLPARGSDR
ncbi:MAG: 23S rRNA (guanosine(2251)-2'-O)-methyltransferase RlmB [Dongiaceae bacterium]